MRPAPREDGSFRKDPVIPQFDHSRILLVMDGECALCSAAARRIARWDRHDAVRIATSASPLGQSLLGHYELSPDDPASWLMIEDGRAYASLDAMIRLGARLRPWMRVFSAFGLLPFSVQDWIYARIARNRYRVFGHADLCAMPDDALRQRLVQ